MPKCAEKKTNRRKCTQKIFNIKEIKHAKNAKNAHRNCKNHTKNAKNDISGITDKLPGLSLIGYPQ
jgi:hypothetical protein